MGFSLSFFRVGDDRILDADREGLAKFLKTHGLHIRRVQDTGALFDTAENPLAFDGSWSDLRLDPLDQAAPVTASIGHATLSDAECAFIYELCVAGRMLIVNHQGGPLYVVPAGNHRAAAVPDAKDTAWVGSPQELAAALGGLFTSFQEFRRAAIDGGAPNDEAPHPQ